MIKNKKGIGPITLIVGIVLVLFLVVGVAGGSLSSFKINSVFESPLIMLFIAFLILYLISSKK